VEKEAQKVWAASVIFKLPKRNNHPVGEKSPNLVTLVLRTGLSFYITLVKYLKL
jgi:hypothetical protein